MADESAAIVGKSNWLFVRHEILHEGLVLPPTEN
jgi:hypothetical protein